MAEQKFKLDIFGLMTRIDSGEKDIWSTLSEEERKGFSALIVMRWMSGCSDPRQIICLNEFVNLVVFTFGKHPELLLNLLSVASSKVPRRYQWLPMKGGKKSKDEMRMRVVKEYYQYTTREAKDVLPLLSKDDMLELADELGWQKEDINLLKKELT